MQMSLFNTSENAALLEAPRARRSGGAQPQALEAEVAVAHHAGGGLAVASPASPDLHEEEIERWDGLY